MDGSVELVMAPSVRPLVKCPTDIGTKQAEFNEIRFITRWSRVLTNYEPGTDRYGIGTDIPWSL